MATPGRLWDLMREGQPHVTNLDRLSFLVIDEAGASHLVATRVLVGSCTASAAAAVLRPLGCPCSGVLINLGAGRSLAAS